MTNIILGKKTPKVILGIDESYYMSKNVELKDFMVVVGSSSKNVEVTRSHKNKTKIRHNVPSNNIFEDHKFDNYNSIIKYIIKSTNFNYTIDYLDNLKSKNFETEKVYRICDLMEKYNPKVTLIDGNKKNLETLIKTELEDRGKLHKKMEIKQIVKGDERVPIMIRSDALANYVHHYIKNQIKEKSLDSEIRYKLNESLLV